MHRYTEEQLDYDRIQECLKLSNLDDFVNKLPNKLQTKVGEEKLDYQEDSYKELVLPELYMNPDIIIFDEATSALDFETEKEVLKSINALRNEKL